MQTAYFQSPLGNIKIKGDGNGVTSISILDTKEEISAPVPEVLQHAVNELQDYFKLKRNHFTFKIQPKGTEFQLKVWQELTQIPFGKTISYLELSKKLGDPKAIRAVASANGKNPLWIVIPCHRVIGTDGSLTGYAGGLWRKKWLLEHENPSNQQLLF
ncbi:methylated-DNA--[protein]-cysteine S-methyltransferase [Flavobacterium sp.]|uniref:methylated-DNA--[protein]-cysteine S-methyltransferase n=1 Tax=Flavobacterium sp. TaxID=239 RepID=UPI00262B4F46|nr:methylated-DNA--[protein]-cysteine S-methyltransferase [Flavobacterium sp.]MDD3003743.1 methylated-DNA--[protein]-cysteine S-methyltransferase [Flavobacterium sp.]